MHILPLVLLAAWVIHSYCYLIPDNRIAMHADSLKASMEALIDNVVETDTTYHA